MTHPCALQVPRSTLQHRYCPLVHNVAFTAHSFRCPGADDLKIPGVLGNFDSFSREKELKSKPPTRCCARPHLLARMTGFDVVRQDGLPPCATAW